MAENVSLTPFAADPIPTAAPDATAAPGAAPAIRRIGTADLKAALRLGLDDFQAKPSHVAFLGIIYPVVGLVLAMATFGAEFMPLLYPLSVGFAFIGPFAAIGLYELSRRRERGLPVAWQNAFDVRHSPSIGSILTMGLVLTVLFILWIGAAHTLYLATLGAAAPSTLGAFAEALFTTPAGWTLIVVGNLVGLGFAVLVLAISAISFPLLLERDVGPAAAAVTSIRAVAANPGPMALWGLIVAVLLFAGSLPFFVGLAVVVPVLGHATWHLYRRVVDPAP